ncbi:MAG: prephenate dehydrogenase/arogenate dehydrogenase family protein, partial [Nitrospinaceae bacterium]|nr:prephenate dehydrogenase/arogenate dehydrogenase family protein [Nitrospinaceae bacterium]NIR57513.1 prephenate dehydrogenase/arogenate dehydrogenase family protein [Nitrospinaceae bacterium]NIS87983.1 prephenate dehydrogenase/arogenate dehydrogenase family protein [Nitrospinaceae bacterium]NIU47028.1 prephenate dehydrogenase/arogenate dehydrogenase family protein [Nitrospinaceae bacterium]NIU99229.1 prephenate dehydrogenase/arogenate dehydrogenase family protein [Nitrospinaceae bacterium]
YALDVREAVRDADAIVVCVPVQAIVPLVREMLPAVSSGCLITDVGSVKKPLVREIESCLPPSVRFVGSHPIAGGEQSGVEASDPDLFQGAQCIVTPTAATDAQALQRIVHLWTEVGMEVVEMDADEHDRVFGAVSHLPHVIAFALMNTIGAVKTKNYPDVSTFSGGGLKDITRIASSHPVMWRDICLTNKEPILHLIDQFQETLNRIRTGIDRDDAAGLEKEFETANRYRLNLTIMNDYRD